MEFQVPMASIIVTNKPECSYVRFASIHNMKRGFLVITPLADEWRITRRFKKPKLVARDSRGNKVYFFTSFSCFDPCLDECEDCGPADCED